MVKRHLRLVGVTVGALISSLMMITFFTAWFNDYKVLVTINEYGEAIWEVPIVIGTWALVIIATVLTWKMEGRCKKPQ